MPRTSDLVAALLGAERGERERLLRAADPAQLESALDELGHQREPAAAEVLGMLETVVDDRTLRKAARRQLHRLRSMGVPMPPTPSASEPTSPRPEPPLPVSEAWATDIDPTGARAVWLLGERPLGGAWFASLLLNDQRGLQDIDVTDTTRKRFRRDLDDARSGAGTWVSLPGDYARQLARESVDLSREQGNGLPTRYRAFSEIFGEAAGPPERALVYETVSPLEVNFNPNWLDESPRLLGEPEVAGWHIALPAELRARALEVARAPLAGILVPGRTPEQQAEQLLADAAQAALTPSARRALRRRLEETAYIFLETDRPAEARLAVAAARALDDTSQMVDQHPLVQLLLAAGLGRLVGSESVGARRASDVLLELLERAGQQRQNQPGAPETRPSGLILPR